MERFLLMRDSSIATLMPIAMLVALVLLWGAPGSWILLVGFLVSLTYRLYVRIGWMLPLGDTGFSFARRGAVREYAFSDVAWVYVGLSPYGFGTLIGLRPVWWKQPVLFVYASCDEMRAWAQAGVRVIGVSSRLEFEARADEFFSSEDDA